MKYNHYSMQAKGRKWKDAGLDEHKKFFIFEKKWMLLLKGSVMQQDKMLLRGCTVIMKD